MNHRCKDRDGNERTDDDGRRLAPDVVTCWGCLNQWCERCDPTPGPLCPWCNGRGYSTAPIHEDHQKEHAR